MKSTSRERIGVKRTQSIKAQYNATKASLQRRVDTLDEAIETRSTEQLSSGRRRGVLQEILDYTSKYNKNSEQPITKKEVSKKFFKDDDRISNVDVGKLWEEFKNEDDGTGSVNNIKAKLYAIATKIHNLLNGDLINLTSNRDSTLSETRNLRLMQLQFQYKDEGQTREHEKKTVLKQARRLGLYDKNNDDDTNFDSLIHAKKDAKDAMIHKLNEMFGSQLKTKVGQGVFINDIQDIFFAKGFNTVETARNTNFKVRLNNGDWMYCGISDNGVRAMLSCERYTDKIYKIYNKLQEAERGVKDFKENQKRYEKLVDIERHIGNVICGNPRDAQEKAISLRSLNERVRPKVVLDAEVLEWGTTACLTSAYDGHGYQEVATMPDFDKEQKKIPYDKQFEHYKGLLEHQKRKQIDALWPKKGVSAGSKQDLQMCLYKIAHKMESAFGSKTSSMISDSAVQNDTHLKQILKPFDDDKKNKQLLELSSTLQECFAKIGNPDTAEGIQEEIKKKEKELNHLNDIINLGQTKELKERLENEHQTLQGKKKELEAKINNTQTTPERDKCNNEIHKLDQDIKTNLTTLRTRVWQGEKLDREIKELEKYKESLNGNNKDKEYDEARKQLNIPYNLLMKLRDSAIQAFQKTVKKSRTPEHNGFIMSVMDLLHPSMTDAEKLPIECSNKEDERRQATQRYNLAAGTRYNQIRCAAEKYAGSTEDKLVQYAVVNIGEKSDPFTISSGKALMEPADAVLRPMQKELDICKGLIYQLEDEYNAKVESIEKGSFETKNIQEWFGINGEESAVSEGDQHLMQFTIDSLITADYKPDNLGHTKGQWQGLVTFDTNIPTASNANGQKFIAGMTKDTKTMNGVVQGANQSPHDFYKAKVGLITELESAYKRFDAFQDVIGKEHAYKAMIQTLTERMRFLQGSNPEEYLAFVNKFSETIQAKITSNTKYITELSKVVRGDTRAARETKEAISDSLKQYGDYLKQLKSLVDIGIGQGNEWQSVVKTAEQNMLSDAQKYNNCITSLVIEKVDDVKGLYVYNAIGTQGGKYYYPFTVEGSKLIVEKGGKGGKGFGLFAAGVDPFASARPKTGKANNGQKREKLQASITVKEAEAQISECQTALQQGSDEATNQALKKATEEAKLQIKEYKSINQTLGVSDIDSFAINNAKINEMNSALKKYEKMQQELEAEKKKIEAEEEAKLEQELKKLEDKYAKKFQKNQRLLKELERRKWEAEKKLQIAQTRNANDEIQRKKQEKIQEYKKKVRVHSAKEVENYKQLCEYKLLILQQKIQLTKQQICKAEQDALLEDGRYQPDPNTTNHGKQLYIIQNDKDADVRYYKEKTHDEIINAMTDALKEAIKNTKEALASIEVDINAEFVERVIRFAIENKGVRKYQEKWKEEEGGGRSEEEFKVARMLSYQYQKIAENSDLFTGKKTPTQFVGARLKRIPKRYTTEIVDNAFNISI